jgi:hypothetical protein
MAGLPFLPRSPRWLAKVGRTEEAIKTLADNQAHGDQDDPFVVADWEEIYLHCSSSREGGRSRLEEILLWWYVEVYYR